MSILPDTNTYTISVDVSVKPFSDIDAIAWIPYEIWSTIEMSTGVTNALHDFIQNFTMNNGYRDLHRCLSRHGLDMKHLKSELIGHLSRSISFPHCISLTVRKKYKTKKERRVYEALGVIEIFWITFKVEPQ